MSAKDDAPSKIEARTSEFHPFGPENSDKHPESERRLEHHEVHPTQKPEESELPRAGPVRDAVFMKGPDRPEAARAIGPPVDTSYKDDSSAPLEAIIDNSSAPTNQEHVPVVKVREAHLLEVASPSTVAGDKSHAAEAASAKPFGPFQRPRVFFHPSECMPQAVSTTQSDVPRQRVFFPPTESVPGDESNAAKSAPVLPPEWSQRPRVFFPPSELPHQPISTTQSAVPHESVVSPPAEPPVPVVITAPPSSSTSLTSLPMPPPTPPPTPPLEETQSQEGFQHETEYLDESSDEDDLYESDGGDGYPVIDPFYYDSDDEKCLGYGRDPIDDDYLADDEDSFAQH